MHHISTDLQEGCKEGAGDGAWDSVCSRASLPVSVPSPQRGGWMQWEESLGTESASLPGLFPFWGEVGSTLTKGHDHGQ